MRLIKKGATRWVIIVGNYAIKFPACHSYRNFLLGLLANMQEVVWWKADYCKHCLCPILFYIPAGFLVVMPRCLILDPEDDIPGFDTLDKFCEREDFIIPAERKCDSFGWYKGKLVAIDYG